MSDNDLQRDVDTLVAPCEHNARETDANGTTAVIAKPSRRRGKDGRSTKGYFENRNSLRHGLRAAKLPPGCSFIHKQTKAFRQAIEDAVVAVHGEVSVAHACYIQTALRSESHANLCARWLRNESAQLDHAQRLAYSAAVVKASEARDRAIEKLGIDKSQLNAWDAAFGVIDAEPATAPNAAESQPGRLNGTPSPEQNP